MGKKYLFFFFFIQKKSVMDEVDQTRGKLEKQQSRGN
jgi:hypothetical protein